MHKLVNPKDTELYLNIWPFIQVSSHLPVTVISQWATLPGKKKFKRPVAIELTDDDPICLRVVLCSVEFLMIEFLKNRLSGLSLEAPLGELKLLTSQLTTKFINHLHHPR